MASILYELLENVARKSQSVGQDIFSLMGKPVLTMGSLKTDQEGRSGSLEGSSSVAFSAVSPACPVE